MSLRGEINYLKKIGINGYNHAINKPFSDDLCARYFFEMGAIYSLLPPLPAKLLDLGCGTGWTSLFFARRGYQVLGIDISPDMIDVANQIKENNQCRNLTFMVANYETLRLNNQYDAVIFFDALHHALNEVRALKSAYHALKPGGICLTVEPGIGHQDKPETQAIAKKFNTTEKDMYPDMITKAGLKAGFSIITVYPQPDYLRNVIYRHAEPGMAGVDYDQIKAGVNACIDNRNMHGLVVLRK